MIKNVNFEKESHLNLDIIYHSFLKSKKYGSIIVYIVGFPKTYIMD